MTQTQLFNLITSNKKWYIGVYSQGYASQLIQRFHSGQLKQSTIEKMFEKFGYRMEEESKWEKK